MGMLPPGATIVPVMLTLVHGFNIQSQNPTVIPGEEEAYFGYSVLQFGSERDRGIVVSAPLARRGNVMGAIYRCHGSSGNCSAVRIPESAQSQVEGVGLSLTANLTSPTELLMCAPSMSYRCGSNTFVNGICYEFDSSLNLTRNVTPAFQGLCRLNAIC
ncbi:integrin alpha-M-like [Scyliorhinus canicula]|uniref:integrin alpha-M-like n=1 Tax=Scyliorhinus canicula TaxID=7830 RepID=UPI0018F6654D|nr:integrin alpha-M-like [Scyliorhinus canicula]